MDVSGTLQAKGADARAEALVASYERAGYGRLAPAILQPAEPFLDLSGEDIRKRMYLTTAPGGGEFCLRPDLTIPVSRDYLASPLAGKPAGYCYLGPVFRHRLDQPAEFLQAGIESFGRPDTAAADAEMLALGLEATAHYGVSAPEIQIGDVALFAALVAALDLPSAWKRRLIKDFNRKANLAQDLDRLVLGGNNARPEYQGVLAALAGSDPKGAHALVTDLLSIAGITAVGGRSVELTYREYELLRFLAQNPDRVFTREMLLNRVWGYDFYGGARTVDVHVRRLRSKIEEAGRTYIETVRNVGYRFHAE
jgi:ATP phosphoribosyltransferase regulatory subunit